MVTERVDATVDVVWRRVTDVEAYPTFMESVLRIERLSDEPAPEGMSCSLVGWEVEIEGSVLMWVEREVTDPKTRTVTFQQVSGDLDRFEGSWTVLADGASAAWVSLRIDFEIGMPMLRDVLDPFAAGAIERNARQMLRSLDDLASRRPGRAPTRAPVARTYHSP